MRRLSVWLSLALLCGCGGGGGGGRSNERSLGDTCPGNPSGELTYTTTWGTVPATASQVVLIRDAAGNVVRSDAMNRGGKATSTLSGIPLSAGVYELRVVLYPQADATGNPTKELSALIDLCGASSNVTVRTLAAENPTSVRVDPGVVTLRQNQTKRFLALARGASGNPCFVPFGAVAWSVSSGIGTVSQTGVFTASAAGTGFVNASVDGTALTGRSPVTVEPFTPTRSKWTVLVYMNAANDLHAASDLNMNQMESVAGNPQLRFVVQWKKSRIAEPSSSFDAVRRYLVQPDTDLSTVGSQIVQNNLVDSQGNALDMGNPTTLFDFIQWGKANYPADRTVLVIWNHGNGWQRKPNEGGTRGFSYDWQYGSSIETWQISQALGSETFEILAWDASLMQMVEVAYEARRNARFIAGSEESPPAEGYPYDAVFRAFRDNPDAPTITLAKGFVDGMVNNPPYANRKITQSVFESSKLATVASALNLLGHQLFNNKATMASVISQVRADAQAYSPSATRVYRDLLHICELLKAEPSVPAGVKSAATNVQSAVAAARVWEGHNQFSAESNGLAVDFSSGSLFQTYRPDYIQLELAKDTFWDEFLGAAP